MKALLKSLILILVFSSCHNDFYKIEYLKQEWDRNSYFGSNTSDGGNMNNIFPLKYSFVKGNLYTEFYSICSVTKKPIFEYVVINDTICLKFYFKNKFYTSSSEMIEESRPFKSTIIIKKILEPKFVYATKVSN